QPADQSGPQAGSDPVRRANRRGAAVVRLFHQRGDDLPFLVPAIPGQPAARAFRFFRYADSRPGQAPATALARLIWVATNSFRDGAASSVFSDSATRPREIVRRPRHKQETLWLQPRVGGG